MDVHDSRQQGTAGGDVLIHSARSGPWWKRLRIALFGLTAAEWMQNRRAAAEVVKRARASFQVEEAEDEMLLLHLEIAEFEHMRGRRPTLIRMSVDELLLLRLLPLPSPLGATAAGETFAGILIQVVPNEARYFELVE